MSDHEFAAELEHVRRLLGVTARRKCLGPEEAEEFSSWALVRILDNDARILRGFSGRSSLRTYLTVVVANLFRDYRIEKWGKWRPSAAARHQGTEAVLLEQLVVRDGIPEGDAFRMLRENHGIDLGDQQLEVLLASIPRRTGRPRPVETDLDTLDGGPRPDHSVRHAERDVVTERANAALAQTLAALDPQDRLLLKMRFDDGFSIADIARCTGLEQKPLYSRFNRIFRALRGALEAADCARDQIERIWSWRGNDLRVVYDDSETSFEAKPATASVQQSRDPGNRGWRP